MAFTQELPFQEGKPLSRITEEEEGSNTAETSPDRQVYMASIRNTEDDEPGSEYDAELLTDVSTDECMTDAPQDENKEHKRIQRLKNAKRAKRMWNAENCVRNPLYRMNLNSAFAAAEDREYHTLIGASAEAALLVQQIQQNLQVQRLQYLTQRALMQLDEKNPMSSTGNTLSRSEHHGDPAQVSRTSRGGPRPQGGELPAQPGQSARARQSPRLAVRAWQRQPRGAATSTTTPQPVNASAQGEA
jgi:hypothetical protein